MPSPSQFRANPQALYYLWAWVSVSTIEPALEESQGWHARGWMTGAELGSHCHQDPWFVTYYAVYTASELVAFGPRADFVSIDGPFPNSAISFA